MDDCPRQDPAYRPAKGKPREGGAFLFPAYERRLPQQVLHRASHHVVTRGTSADALQAEAHVERVGRPDDGALVDAEPVTADPVVAVRAFHVPAVLRRAWDRPAVGRI